MSRELDATTLALDGQHLIEASAGTGKTFNIALIYLRLLLERNLSVREIAVVTFTDAATRELRGRLRGRIAEAISRLEGTAPEHPDELDRILEMHRGDMTSLRAAIDALSAALVGFDEARVSTLHGLCRQLLAEHAFAMGLPFFELDNDAGNEAAHELVRDFWRRHVVAEADAAVDAVLDRWDTPEAFATDLLRSQVLALPATRIDPLDAPAWVEQSRRALERHLDDWRRLFAQGQVAIALQQLQEAIAQKTLKSAQATPLGVASMQRCVRACADAAVEVDIGALDALAASAIADAVSEKARKAGWRPPAELAAVSACVEAVQAAAQTLRNALLARFTGAAIAFVREGLAARRERLRRLGFDDLIGLLHAHLEGADGARLAQAIATDIPALLVDEFQDTDTLQYAILKRIHAAREDAVLMLIGDPKQAIYRFRGGDIHTYHAAARDAGANRHTLRDNWRSDAPLIAAANAIFDGVEDPFLVDFIGFEPARYPSARETSAHWLATAAPLTVWRLPDRIEKDKRKPWTTPAFSERVLAAVCAEIRGILSEARKRECQPPSMAVLVQSNRQAEQAARQLAQWNIACDYLSAASIYASAEALEVERLLAALDAPADAARVRAALATELLGYDLQALLEAQQDLGQWESQLARIALLRQRWLDAGPYAAIAHCVQAAAVRLLPRWDGRRRVTNLLHLAELLQQESARRATPGELLHWLGQRRAEADEQRGAGHAEQLRPADDASAVQVLTVHRSKGLQYDVVFAPFAMATFWKRLDSLTQADEAVAWHAGDELRIDIGGPQWHAHALAQRDEQFAESLRLAYVAITRARHRVWLAWAWANTGRFSTSLVGPYAWLWFRTPDMQGPVMLDRLGEQLDRIDAALEALVARSGHCIRLETLAPDAPPVEPLAEAVETGKRVVAEFHGRIERGLETSSYSRLFGGGQHAPVADHDETSAAAVAPSPSPVLDPVPQWPRGADFGNCVHQVFEEVAFEVLAEPGVPADLARICGDHGYVGEDVETIAAIARASVRSELVAGSGLRLMALERGEFLAELEFLFPLGGARLEVFEELLAGHPAHARERGELVSRRSGIRGLMTGFIDLVLRWQGRYYVVDYKTNLLGSSRGDYAPERLPAAIRASDYDLQYLIYLVALQRFLRTRLGAAYDYEHHVGGALYLFVRGMREGDAAGIHHDRPPAALVDALDAWCDGDRS
ncbi:exodeoxyribonuclease V subunit beta [Dokdonella immobilis]|uniref:RecBCD enzyme subunit RecB n=1 Tax=Dokdonella immobilis TaxID=578942 RepID=A0A1I5AG62_9GAMM|nr:exodeoxyribonuclease V subunit beta [Dokdonella immobilis]SFN61486.1 DNA helicase/exodeoxyribonuclease V, beta subunit [Dokdonella immobilis]